MKIENWSRKRCHKLEGIGVGRIRTVPFSSDSAYDSDAYGPVKLDSRSRKQKRKNHPITICHVYSLASAYDSDNLVFTGLISIGVISGIGRKLNRSDSAYDSDFRFSVGRKRFYSDSDSDSDCVASENQPIVFCIFQPSFVLKQTPPVSGQLCCMLWCPAYSGEPTGNGGENFTAIAAIFFFTVQIHFIRH